MNGPLVRIGGHTVVVNRHAEQIARYAVARRANTTRNREEAEAKARVEVGAEPEAEPDAPLAQRRRLKVPHETDATSSASPISDTALALAGQEPQEGDDGDAALLGLLDPSLFNEAGLVGDDSGDLQEVFEQNEWATEPMQED